MLRCIPAILGLAFLAACGKPTDKEVAVVPTHGSKLPDLVFAANAPVFDTGRTPFVEAVWTDGVWKIHDGGVWIADGTDEIWISSILEEIKDKRPDSRILISAEKKIAFREIETMVRGAASAGLTGINFLVSSGSPKPGTHALHLDLPKMGDEEFPYPLDPFFIRLDAPGAVYSGTGSATSALDPPTADHTLPGLNSKLEMFAASARAARSPALCQVYIEPAANYQRAIDLISRFHEHRIFMRFENFRIEQAPGTHRREELQNQLKTKPRPPWERKIILQPGNDE